MSINEKIAKTSFWVWFGIMSSLVAFSYIYSYVYIDFPKFKEANPVIHGLALSFSQTFNVSYESYYIYCLPLVLLFFYGAAKFARWLIPIVDKKTNIKRGDNHTIIFISLLTLPNTIHQIIVVLFGIYLIGNYQAEFKYTGILGIVLAIAFLILSETKIFNKK